MRYVIAYGILAILSGCTYSITLIHTGGNASDVIDETQKSSFAAEAVSK